MLPRVHVTPLDSAYPSRLRFLRRAPASLTLEGGLVEAEHTVAIVGSRKASASAFEQSRTLAAALAARGAAIVSGGAVGVDTAAHEGALDAKGRTWVVAGTGCEHVYPEENKELFRRVARGPGAMIWPFAPPSPARAGAFPRRNRILVSLADAVVVAQAGERSGALNAAAWARALRKPLWVIPAPTWLAGFEGSRRLLEAGAHPLTDLDALLQSLALSAPPAPPLSLTGEVAGVLDTLTHMPLHVDEIARRAQVTAQAAAAALLTLALEAVVVEGPPGFFRRRHRYNA